MVSYKWLSEKYWESYGCEGEEEEEEEEEEEGGGEVEEGEGEEEEEGEDGGGGGDDEKKKEGRYMTCKYNFIRTATSITEFK